MARVSPTIFLFHGNDSLASSKALRGWERLFTEKHGDVSKYRIESDEHDDLQFGRALEQAIMGQGLFSTKRFCIVKRPTALEKGNSRPYSAKLVAQLSQLVAAHDADCTVVIWEDKALSDTHVITKWFVEHEATGSAKCMNHSVPHTRELVTQVQASLQQHNLALSKNGAQHLYQLLTQREKEQRLLGQLRSQESLSRDVRSWWVQQIVELLILLLPAPSIVEAEDIDRVGESLQPQVSIFEVANAITGGGMALALQLLSQWETQQVEDSQYFALISILRKQASTNKKLLRLLADAELLTKNGVVPLPLLLHLLVRRLNAGESELLPARTVWLSKLPTP